MQFIFRWIVQYVAFMVMSLTFAVVAIALMGLGFYFIAVFPSIFGKIGGTVVFVCTYFVLRDINRSIHNIMLTIWTWLEQAR